MSAHSRLMFRNGDCSRGTAVRRAPRTSPVGRIARRHACTSQHHDAHTHWRRPVYEAFKGWMNGSSDSTSRGSSQDAEPEEEEGESTLVPIGTTGGVGGVSEEAFGPLAVLLVGFMSEEVARVQALLTDMGASMVKVLPCTFDQLSGSLADALGAPPATWEPPPLGMRRSVILSGMYGGEVVDVVTSYREAGLPPAAFAAAVPNNWQRRVSELTDAIWQDHSAMMAREEQLRQQRALAGDEGQ